MQASEILRKFADMIDGHESNSHELEAEITPVDTGPHEHNQAMLTPWSHQDREPQLVNTKSLTSPLQQKLDILKQLVEPETCNTCGSTPCGCNPQTGQPDELAIIRQNAGIAPVVIMAADDENPVF